MVSSWLLWLHDGDFDLFCGGSDVILNARAQVQSAEARARVAKLGLAAVLAYGLFDAVTYTTFFVLAFLGYEKSTGKNPAANLKALLGVCSLCLSSVVSSCSILLLGTAILLSISIASAKLDGEVHGWQPRPTEIKCTLDLSCNRTQF